MRSLEPASLDAIAKQYGTADTTSIVKYVLDQEMSRQALVVVWCSSWQSLSALVFNHDTARNNPEHPYTLRQFSGDVFGYNPDRVHPEIAMIRDCMKDAWGDPQTYDVGISFAAGQRDYVRELANYLRMRNRTVFFDEFHQTQMWGNDGLEFLQETYVKKCKRVIMCLSEDYVERAWPTYERKQILGKQFMDQTQFILPIRFDDVEIPGLPPQYFYLDARRLTATEIGAVTIDKLATLDAG
jgi:hypothetical protein